MNHALAGFRHFAPGLGRITLESNGISQKDNSDSEARFGQQPLEQPGNAARRPDDAEGVAVERVAVPARIAPAETSSSCVSPAALCAELMQ